MEAISECLLFTVVGCAITGEHAAFFSLGDGMIIVNDRHMKIGPYPDNAPPYLAYGLLPECRGQADLRFTLHAHVSTEELDTFLIGSDGVNDLIDTPCAGGIEDFWTDPLNYENPYAISNKLRLLIRSEQRSTGRNTGRASSGGCCLTTPHWSWVGNVSRLRSRKIS